MEGWGGGGVRAYGGGGVEAYASYFSDSHVSQAT